MANVRKISNYGDLQDFICKTIRSQKGFFDSEDIVRQIQISGKVASFYDSNILKKLSVEKIMLLIRLNEVSYSQKEKKYFIIWPRTITGKLVIVFNYIVISAMKSLNNVQSYLQFT